MFELEDFVKDNIILRKKSLLTEDIENYREILDKRIAGKRVLVIGGGGSIGSSFVDALLNYKPSELCIVDTNENSLTELTRWFRSGGNSLPREYYSYPMDYNSDCFKKMFRGNKGFDIVANFSAHKHVRSEKDIFSVEAMLKNNFLNAIDLMRLLCEYPPEVYFCVSTDKAANPANIMGASKRLMEDMIFSYMDDFNVKTARFANVAFSNGSLLDGFVRRIENYQPISAPMDVKRYFVSQREAGQICLLSTFVGENGEILFPKLKKTQTMQFDEIALKLLEYYGYEPYICNNEEDAIKRATDLKNGSKRYPVFFSMSDTSGEKQYEEFYTDEEWVDLDRFYSLGAIKKDKVSKESLSLLKKELERAFENIGTKKEDIVNIITKYIPGFKHIETGKSLDSKM